MYGLRARRLTPRVGALLAAVLGAVLVGPAPPAAARDTGPPEPTAGPATCTVEAEMPPVSQPGVAPASPPMAIPLAPIVTCTVEVPVSTPIVVPDPATEALHLGIAAGLGAVVAAAATAARQRRRPPSSTSPGDGFVVGADDPIDLTDIDLTDIVRSPAAA
jgi:hypothetical protein